MAHHVGRCAAARLSSGDAHDAVDPHGVLRESEVPELRVQVLVHQHVRGLLTRRRERGGNRYIAILVVLFFRKIFNETYSV